MLLIFFKFGAWEKECNKGAAKVIDNEITTMIASLLLPHHATLQISNLTVCIFQFLDFSYFLSQLRKWTIS